MSKKKILLQCDCHFIRAGMEGVINTPMLSEHVEIVASVDELAQCAKLLLNLHSIDIVILTLSYKNYELGLLLKITSALLPNVHPGSKILILNNILTVESLKTYLRKLKNVHAIMDVSLSLKALHEQLLSMSQNVSDSEQQSPGASSNPLSSRELDVLHRLLRGDAALQVARDLRINYKTVSCHKRSALTKLGVRSLQPLLSLHLAGYEMPP